MLPQRESLPAVTAAGVVAIIFASLGIATCGLITLVLLVLPNLPSSGSTPPLESSERMMAIGIYAIFFLICIGELVIAINVLRRRNWARIAILVWAGIMAFFSAVIIIAVLFALNLLPKTGPSQGGPAFQMLIKFFVLALYGTPLGVAIWWLILFNRPRVAAAFKLPAAVAAWSGGYGFPAPAAQPYQPIPALPRKPSCPVPVLIVAVILLFSAAITPLILMLQKQPSAPLFAFGFVLSPSIGRIVLSVLSLTNGVLSIGLIRLKPQALDSIIGLHAIVLFNSILSLASPTFLRTMHDAMQQHAMNNPAFHNGLPFLSYNFLRWILIGGIAFSSAMLGVLVGFRDRFRKEAAEAGS
jgi:hypothetical protein